MSRFLLPAAMVALVLTAFAVAAQVREKPRQVPPAPPQVGQKAPAQVGQKAPAANKDLAPRAKPAADKDARADGNAHSRRERSRVYLGVWTVPVEDLSNRTRKKMKLETMDGVIVVDVMPGSPAEEAGVRHGDVIMRVNDKLIEDEEELIDDLNKLGPGKPVKLTVLHEGKKKEITAKLSGHPANEGFGRGGSEEAIDEIMGMCHHNAQRIERLERQISRLQKQLADKDKGHSARSDKE